MIFLSFLSFIYKNFIRKLCTFGGTKHQIRSHNVPIKSFTTKIKLR